MAHIDQLDQKILEAQGEVQIRKLKNKKSAYVSRLGKREKQEKKNE